MDCRRSAESRRRTRPSVAVVAPVGQKDRAWAMTTNLAPSRTEPRHELADVASPAPCRKRSSSRMVVCRGVGCARVLETLDGAMSPKLSRHGKHGRLYVQGRAQYADMSEMYGLSRFREKVTLLRTLHRSGNRSASRLYPRVDERSGSRQPRDVHLSTRSSVLSMRWRGWMSWGVEPQRSSPPHGEYAAACMAASSRSKRRSRVGAAGVDAAMPAAR